MLESVVPDLKRINHDAPNVKPNSLTLFPKPSSADLFLNMASPSLSSHSSYVDGDGLVACLRGLCRLPYLNGAALACYGVPVRFEVISTLPSTATQSSLPLAAVSSHTVPEPSPSSTRISRMPSLMSLRQSNGPESITVSPPDQISKEPGTASIPRDKPSVLSVVPTVRASRNGKGAEVISQQSAKSSQDSTLSSTLSNPTARARRRAL